MEKVKVSKEVFEALQFAEKNFFGGLAGVLEYVILKRAFLKKGHAALNKLTKTEMLRIYKYGYELEQTPEEKLLKEFELLKEESAQPDLWHAARYYGMLEGVLLTLDILDIKVKGINE